MYALFDGALDLRLFKVNLFLRVCKCLNGALDIEPIFHKRFLSFRVIENVNLSGDL